MDARATELEAMATRVQPCGPVTDYFGCGPFEGEVFGDGPVIGDRRLALCRCVHGKEWVEGGDCGTEDDICDECSRAAWAFTSAPRASTSAQPSTEDG